MSKFEGKFRKNNGFAEDIGYVSNFIKLRKKKSVNGAVKKSKHRNHDDSHKRYEFIDS